MTRLDGSEYTCSALLLSRIIALAFTLVHLKSLSGLCLPMRQIVSPQCYLGISVAVSGRVQTIEKQDSLKVETILRPGINVSAATSGSRHSGLGP